MRDRRQAQRGFADGFITEQVDEFWDDWMRAVDQVLDDDDLVATVYEALVTRRAQSRTRGRPGFPEALEERWRRAPGGSVAAGSWGRPAPECGRLCREGGGSGRGDRRRRALK